MLKLVFVAVIASNGVFMATAKCKKARCRKDEVWESCPDSQCYPLTCSEVGFHINCPSSSDECNCWGDPRCICRDGKVRDDKGKCINPEDCPECGGDPNAVVDPCARLCPEGVPCAAVCIPNTCKCRKGYEYDQHKNKCVPIEECSRVCGPNEVYSSCANGGCGKWNCTQIGEPDLCIDPLHCEGGCICKTGYLRARDGTCVPEEQCYYDVCPKNEIYDLCPASCPRRTCGLDDRAIFCIRPLPVGDPNCPPPKCRCQDGFYRDHRGNCVPWDQCPLCSKPNEVYHPCPPTCPFRRCDIDDSVVSCAPPPPLGDPACQPGCICAEGFVRNDKGYCVTREECPKCTGAHQVYDKCPKTCPPQTCESIGKVYYCPAELPCKQCEGQCMCEPGYYKNKKGECIAKEDCLKCTGPHEFFSCWVACDNVCATLSVQNQTHCPIINVDCNRMCYCEEGYARDANNICVPIDQCPQNQCTKPNEEYQQCPNCNPGTCDSIGKIYHCPLRPCKLTDPGECRCKAGFYRNKAGDCVTEEQCAKERCNKPNEEYQQCVKDCSPGTCESIGKSYSCPAHPNCDGQCRCKPGYFWNKLGECITKEQCYRCNGTHEYFSCGPACDNVCATLDKQNKTNCPIKNKRCNEKCYCEDGYARDENNVCVPIDQCKAHCNKPNEIYHLCPPKCPPRRCDVDDRLIRCAAPPKLGDPECEPGCICADGFVRNDKGYCVTRDECPQNQCNKPHEEYQKCPSCSPGTCESIGKEYSCAHPADESLCRGACRCQSGYYWDRKGECITEEQCLKCTGPNEFYSCGGACDNVCSNLSTQNQTNCPIVNIKCNEKCYCDEGYARDDCGICIPIDQCPPETTTSTTTTAKPTSGSRPETCSSDGLELLLTGNAAFTAKFLYEVVKGNPKASVITSPASVLIPMGELALYSEGDTYDELIKVLNLRSKDEIRCVFPQLISKLSTQKDVILNLLARIFANADYPLSDNFLDDTKTVFNAEAENLNFTDNVAAASRINQWVEDQTNNRIQDIATPDMFSALTRLVLANAIYFLGNWEYQFNPNNTEPRDFHRADNSIIQLPTMFQEKTFRYANVSSLDCKVLELPYKGNFSFLIFLPNTNDGVLDLLQKLLDTAAFYDAYDSMYYETVEVSLPKMNVTMEFDLADILKKIGINEIFNTNGAGLSGILKKDEPLFISTAVQKAFIEVNEIGTEAAAANVIVVGTTSARDTLVFNADHPFIFYILSGRDPVFCGVFS